MNPSTSGWIKKFDTINKDLFVDLQYFKDLQTNLRDNGFLYGLSKKTLIDLDLEQKLSQDEIEKFNLLTSFYLTYKVHHDEILFDSFIESVLEYFKNIEAFELSLWDKFIAGKDANQQLERIINEHIQIDNNVFTKHFNKTTINSLLFIDILGYNYFLNGKDSCLKYVRDLEHVIVNITNDINSFKKNKSTEENNSLRAVKDSIYYQKNTSTKIDLDYRHFIETNYTASEKKYFLDIALVSIWEPLFHDDNSYNFIKALGTDMNLPTSIIEESIDKMVQFYDVSKDSSLFKATNYINNFYDNTSQLVIKLIKRNSKRIVKEISQSKELMVLLSQSTIRNLSKEEQEKVEYQLLDILKTIPSLAIFLLPGGAILLPIFAKLLPNLMPSAFDDNKVD